MNCKYTYIQLVRLIILFPFFSYRKTNTFGGIWYAMQIFSVILIFLKSLFWEKLKMPSYSNIFQQEISFRTQIVDLENEDKNSAW